MRLSGESANLEFDTGNIVFLANTTRDIFVFQQFNLRVALGSMYNRYNKFYMVFNSVASFLGGGTTYSAGDVTGITSSTAWLIGVTGLDFINNSVDGVISKTAIFPISVSLAQNGNNNGGSAFTMNGVVFNKPSNDIQDITIQPYLVRGLQPGKAVTGGINQIGDYNFSFTVYGLED
jgi:hypothetical protein